MKNERSVPVIVFTYKRTGSLRGLIQSLQKCPEAQNTMLYVFSDGPKNAEDFKMVKEVRNYILSISGFKEVKYFFSEANSGLAKSIISGVSQILNISDSVIVLEDDLIVSPDFLNYMNKALAFYSSNNKVFSISGFTMPIKGLATNDVYFTKRSSSWGWGTWKNRWDKIDWQVEDYAQFSKDKKIRRRFNEMGSDMSSMLDRTMQGKINSWAIIWCYNQFKYDQLTVYPAASKVINAGFASKEATHTTEKYNRFKAGFFASDNLNYNFNRNPQIDKKLMRQFIRPYSIPQRIIYKILNVVFGYH